MYIPRRLAGTLQHALTQFPAVLITGPRQSGKTTMLREEVGSEYVYTTFDDPLQREFARRDPRGFIDQFKGRPAILDEVQYVPEILSTVKVAIDADRAVTGRWILTGSQQFGLMHDVSESLAGRIAVLDLLPFNAAEAVWQSAQSAMWRGGYPEPALHPERRDLWLASYVRTYVDRDVRQLRNIGDLRSFDAFVGLCAARHGQTLNMAALSRQLGISGPTVRDWISVLEASYVLFLLPPWHRNYGKRVVKSPKSFFVDSALVTYLTRQPSEAAALAGAMGGALFEGLVVVEALKSFANRGIRPVMHHWRSHDGLEVDLLLGVGPRLVPVEIKLTSTPRAGHVRALDKVCEVLGDDVEKHGLLVCRVDKPTPLPGGHLALPWREFGSWLDQRLRSPLSPAADIGGR